MERTLALILAFVSTILVAACASAQVDPQTDGVGIYFDLEAESYCRDTTQQNEMVTAYLLLTRTSAEFIGGWILRVEIDGPAVAPVWTLTGGLDIDTSLEGFVVGVGTGWGIPGGDVGHVATCRLTLAGPQDQVTFAITGNLEYPDWIIDDMPVYASNMDAGDIRLLHVSNGTLGEPCARINGCGIVSADASTFSTLKQLYR